MYRTYLTDIRGSRRGVHVDLRLLRRGTELSRIVTDVSEELAIKVFRVVEEECSALKVDAARYCKMYVNIHNRHGVISQKN
jgi:hypothetical protein